MIKAAFFDVDNTLYYWHGHRFIPSAIEAVKQMQKKGIKVFLCSSRPYDSMKAFGCFDLGIHWDGWVSSSGGCAFVGGHFVHKELVEPKDAWTFLRIAKQHGLMMEIITPKTRVFTAPTDENFDRYVHDYAEPPCPIKKYHGGQVTGFLLFAPEEYDSYFQKELPSFHYFRFHPYAVDAMPIAHSKGRGLAAIMRYLGYAPDEGIGFGDDDPDILMKEGLAHFVAMGDAKESVKKEAEYITAPIEKDGIMQAAKHFGLVD